MPVTRWPLVLMVVAALVAGCTGDDARPRSEPRRSASPTHASEVPIPQGKLDRLAGFLDRAEARSEGVAGGGFELQRVCYTSPTDAAAELYDRRDYTNSSTVIVTTEDNWAHAAGLAIS